MDADKVILRENVALLAEGVDRNTATITDMRKPGVALLAEGVDRNPLQLVSPASLSPSPSVRRAWIEIQGPEKGHTR